jgi:hypothetical protein
MKKKKMLENDIDLLGMVSNLTEIRKTSKSGSLITSISIS